MGVSQRRKGAVGEREAQEALAAHGICAPRQARNGVAGGADLAGDGIVVEVKRRKGLIAIESWLAQAETAAQPTGALPCVMCRSDSRRWILALRLDDLSDFVRLLSQHRCELMAGGEDER